MVIDFKIEKRLKYSSYQINFCSIELIAYKEILTHFYEDYYNYKIYLKKILRWLDHKPCKINKCKLFLKASIILHILATALYF